MKYILFLIIGLFGAATSCHTKVDEEHLNFKVTVVNYYFGREEVVMVLTPDSINSEWGFTRGQIQSYKRKLEAGEKKKVNRFMRKFRPEDLKEQYIDENVEDGINLKFEIIKNGKEKTIFVSNRYNETLGELVELMNSLAPEDLFGYHKNAFRE